MSERRWKKKRKKKRSVGRRSESRLARSRETSRNWTPEMHNEVWCWSLCVGPAPCVCIYIYVMVSGKKFFPALVHIWEDERRARAFAHTMRLIMLSAHLLAARSFIILRSQGCTARSRSCVQIEASPARIYIHIAARARYNPRVRFFSLPPFVARARALPFTRMSTCPNLSSLDFLPPLSLSSAFSLLYLSRRVAPSPSLSIALCEFIFFVPLNLNFYRALSLSFSAFVCLLGTY